jgi:hypothetical protein
MGRRLCRMGLGSPLQSCSTVFRAKPRETSQQPRLKSELHLLGQRPVRTQLGGRQRRQPTGLARGLCEDRCVQRGDVDSDGVVGREEAPLLMEL